MKNKYVCVSSTMLEVLNKNIREKKLSTVALAVLNIIENNIDDENICTINAKCIAEYAGIHSKAVYRYINALIDLNILSIYEYNYRKAYRVNPEYIKISYRK